MISAVNQFEHSYPKWRRHSRSGLLAALRGREKPSSPGGLKGKKLTVITTRNRGKAGKGKQVSADLEEKKVGSKGKMDEKRGKVTANGKDKEKKKPRENISADLEEEHGGVKNKRAKERNSKVCSLLESYLH